MTRTSAAWIVLALLPAAAGAEKHAPKAYVAVFDFVSAADGGRFGKKLADSVRLRLRRHKEYEVLDRLTIQGATKPLAIGADPKKVIALMNDQVGANLGVYGTVSRGGQAVRAEVRVLDLTAKAPRIKAHVFTDSTERAVGVVATGIVEALRRKAEWTPPEYGDEAEPTKKQFAKPLNANGDFEKAYRGWDAPDNVSTFLQAGPAGRGKVLRIRTDLARDPWLAYRRRLRFGEADPKRPPKIATDTSYGSVAGLEGVHYRGEYLKAKAGQRYWLIADMKGKTAGIFFPKIYVKGYLDYSAQAKGLPELSLRKLGITARDFAAMPAAKRKKLIARDAKKHPERYRRECFRWYLACRNEENVWKHYAAPFPPRGGLSKKVRWLRVEVYAYWPPGTYLFNDVHLYKDPRQKAPVAEEKARTPNFDKR